ncbi:esterase family protein [Glaciecola sp. KUL10]|uniref:alpha/beta hydrolase n=1 Tax=Glaciecola sp. (strain KUL10) TaxID=2161813 RepID=UPI000D84EBEC|nr:alpha/beta hydrolase-fold protein [Glaciecola sp. KUL10]GBL05745.1 peptide-methionine-S-oxide reductase [Glaciecola sp. KUL10]
MKITFKIICKYTLQFLALWSFLFSGFSAAGYIEKQVLHAKTLENNLLGIDPKREVLIYLPDSYANNIKRYPVVYYFHNKWWSNTQLFGEGYNLKSVLDSAIKAGKLDEVIVVAGDFTSPQDGAFYSDAPSSGRWLSHINDELIPFIEENYRTQNGLRIGVGDFFGGYAVMRLAMDFPGIFTAVYAMHPVGTDEGEVSNTTLPDWRTLNTAQSWEELSGNNYNRVFMAMAQAYLPNPNKPPFYADLMIELKDEQLVVNSDNVRKLYQNFLLRDLVPYKSEALKQLSAFYIDWGRIDPTVNHVQGNQRFTRLLLNYGVEHEAEEYNGGPWDKTWGEGGRIHTRVLPFIQKVIQQ